MSEPRLEYELIVRQQPKAARMCGLGGKADRRPIDPPPIIQLRVLEYPHPSSSRTEPVVSNDFLQNPYYFMFASLASTDSDDELHVLKDGKTRCTTGSIVSSLYHLKDTENNNQDAGFFVFPDLSVRTEGSYRLKLSLFEVKGPKVHHCKSIFSNPFYVYTAKKFPGMEESTQLSCSLADQGIKIRIRKEIRQRKKAGAANPIGPDDGAEDSSFSLSPTIANNKRPRQVSDVGKGKGKATTRIAKRPKLVEASPPTEQIDLQESPTPNLAPGPSGNSNVTSASIGPESWTAGENGNGFSTTTATSSWAPPPPPAQSVHTSSADPEYQAVQHPPPSRPGQNPTLPYPPPSQPHPQPATPSPNWGNDSTQSPQVQHNVQQPYVPTPAPSSGYSSGSAAGPTQQHQLVTPSPPSAPIPQHPNSGPISVSNTLPRQPGRHAYDVAPSHGTPYGSPLEMHAQPPTHVNPQAPGVTYAPAYPRYYPSHMPSQSPSIYSYTPANNAPPNDYGDRELCDRDERAGIIEGRDPHLPSNAPGPPPSQPQPSGYGPYPVPHPQSHYPSPVPPPASAGYTPQHTPYMSSSSTEREPTVHYNPMPTQYHQSPHHQQQHHPQQHHPQPQPQPQQQMMRQAPPPGPPQAHPPFPGPTYPGAHSHPPPHQSPSAYQAYRRQDNGGLIYDAYGQNGQNDPNGNHDRSEPRVPSPPGTGPAPEGDSQVQQHLTLPPLRGGAPGAQYAQQQQQHMHHHHLQQQQQQPHPPRPPPQQPQQQRTPIMAHHPHPHPQQHPMPGYYPSPPPAPQPQPHHPLPHRTMSGMSYSPQPLPGAYVPSPEDGMYHPEMYAPQHRPAHQGAAAQWKRPMMVGNRTPPREHVGMHRTNSMSLLHSQSPASIVSGALDDGVARGHVGNGVDGSVGIKKNPLSIGHIVSDRSST